MPEERLSTAFSDVADVASVKTGDQLPLVVGGQAVNIWASVYSARIGLPLQSYAPFTTKDLDLWGPRKILESLAQKYNVKVTLSPPRGPGIGYVVIPRGPAHLKVELLTSLYGMRRIEEQNGIQLNILGVTIRVLDAISCLKAKIANAADLDQSNRQDVKHVHIMKLCAREFAMDILAQGGKGQISERLAVNYLQDLRATIAGPKTKLVTAKWEISFDEVIPIEAIRQSTMQKVQNFVRFQLDQSIKRRPKNDLSRQQKPGGPKMSI